jgi:NADPH:quinone reductase-like Zn-dependent oxidoreductase
MYGTASRRAHETVRSLGGVPIDYRAVEFVEEVRRLAPEGVDVVFDGIGGAHIWRSRKVLRAGGKVVTYGLTSSLVGGKMAGGWRQRLRGLERLRGLGIIGLAMAAAFFRPGRRRVLPYSIQWLKRRKPVWFREDLTTLLRLLSEEKIKPIIATRFPLREIRRAHEFLGAGGVTGKIVLLPRGI